MNWISLHETEMRKQTFTMQKPRNPKDLTDQANAQNGSFCRQTQRQVLYLRRSFAQTLISYPLRFSRARNPLACSSPTTSRLAGSQASGRPRRIAIFDRWQISSMRL